MTSEELVTEDLSIDGFFERSNLTSIDRKECSRFIKQLYPYTKISLPPCQGYCSMTVYIGDDKIIQFRPSSYQLNLRITKAAQLIYGNFAPETSYIATLECGLLAYQMRRIEGTSIRDLRIGTGSSIPKSHLARLCKDFASFHATSWHYRDLIQLPLGEVGSSVKSRLQRLSTDLPARFQPMARQILGKYRHIEDLPWVLNHGDVVAANIMVDASTGRLTGLVDWAEAERLPFGTCFYGLEEILGEMTPGGFQYHADATDLRDMFWAELKDQIPEMRKGGVLEAVKLARDLGVLLWHGIAFDNGAINRVVQEGRDNDEISKLDSFLDLKSSWTEFTPKI